MTSPKDFLDPMTQDEPERVKGLREQIARAVSPDLWSRIDYYAEDDDWNGSAALNAKNMTFNAADRILAIVNPILSVSEKRAEEAERKLTEATRRDGAFDDMQRCMLRAQSERDSSQASLLRVVEECAAVAEHQQLAWEPLVSALYFKSQGDAYKHGCQDCAAAIRRTALSPHKET